MAANYLIYTKPKCNYCVLAKELFLKHKLEYNEIELNKDTNESVYILYTSKLKDETGQSTFPFIFLNKQFIGGYTELLISINGNENPITTDF